MHDLYAYKTGEVFVLAKEYCSALLAQARPTMFYIYTSITCLSDTFVSFYVLLCWSMSVSPNLSQPVLSL